MHASRRAKVIAGCLLSFAAGLLVGLVVCCRSARGTSTSDRPAHGKKTSYTPVTRARLERKAAVSAVIEMLKGEARLARLEPAESCLVGCPDAITRAIRLLGDLRAVEAVPVLLDLLPFSYDPGSPPLPPEVELEIKSGGDLGGLRLPITVRKPRGNRPTPALDSLVKIGEPAVKPTLEFLRSPDWPWSPANIGVVYQIALFLREVEGKTGLARLEAAVLEETDPIAQNRLKKCIEGLVCWLQVRQRDQPAE